MVWSEVACPAAGNGVCFWVLKQLPRVSPY